MKRPVVWLVSAFICGIILYFNFSAGLFVAMAGGLLYPTFAYKKPVYLLLVPAMLAGLIPCAVFNKTMLSPPVGYDGETVEIRFTVTEICSDNGKYKIKTEKIGGSNLKTTGYLYSASGKYKLFDKAVTTASFKAVKNFSKNNSFDYKTYLINRGAFFTAYEYENGTVTGKAKPGITGRILQLREKVLNRTKNFSSSRNYGFFSAVLTGEKSGLSGHTNDVFRKLGISHLLAVSGLHISILLGLLSSVLGTFGLKGLPKAIICTLFLIAVVPFMNSSPSVIRAAIMGIILLWSEVVRSDNDSVTAMCIAAFVILLFSPYSIYDAGCILSFTATAGIVLLSPILEHFFEKHFKSSHPQISVMLAAETAIIPASIYYCGEISYISFITNLIFVPVFPILIVLLLITCALGGVIPFLAPILNTAANIYLGAAEEISKLPGLAAEIAPPDPLILLSVIPIFLFFMFGKRMKPLFAVISLVLLTTGGINLYGNINNNHLYFISADQTRTAVIKTPKTAALVIECNFEKSTAFDFENIKAFLDKKGIRKVRHVYLLGNPENAIHIRKELAAEYSPEFLTENKEYLGNGITLSAENGKISITGKRKIALLAHMFSEPESCQAAFEAGTATLSTVFDSENQISVKNKNIDIVFTENGVRTMKTEN